ncbi:neuroguidin-like [Culicoides brevitarsis]|uniref:neuroguidin-like n=1 Tax=Culicoides brevitarsis TaxID=469753 RepID=UPI00307B1CE2
MVQAAALESEGMEDGTTHEEENNLPAALKLLSEMSTNAEQVSSLVDQMLERVRSGEFSTEYGLSFLEVKYQMLLDYLINLSFVVLRKTTGQTIENNPVIDRLIEIRTVLEKIRPIDYKLRYQIDKLVKTATTGVEDVNDPSNFKARPDLLTSHVTKSDSDEDSEDDDDADSDDAATKKLKDQVYRPPKLTAMHYDDDPAQEKSRKQFERLKKRALQSSIIQEMKEEYLDTPVEISEGSKAVQLYNKAQKERERFEEDNFVRLPITKADKHRQRQMTTLGNLGNEITSFRDISMLTGGGSSRKDAEMSGKKGKKRKGGAGKKIKGKKRKFH